MTQNSDEHRNNTSALNPFSPTKRDIDRTEELANKNAVIAGLLTFFVFPFSMFYLNRGVNTLKILGSGLVIGLLIGLGLGYSNKSDKQVEKVSTIVGVAIGIAAAAESHRAVTLASQRQSENSF